MLGFFKVNDPYRLLAALGLLLLIRLPFYWSGLPLTIPELKWLLIGEKLAQGGIIYKDIWDHIGPFSAIVYEWLNILFGRTDTPYKVLSVILVIIQAGIFNFLMLKNKAYNQNTYVPAMVYVVAMNLSFDFLTLSPVLMGMTFVLLAINNLFKRMDNTTRDELFVNTGIYLGVATLIFQPFFLYFLVTIISLVLFTGSIIRRMLLLVYGYFLTIALVAFYYLWYDSWPLFRISFIESIFSLNPYIYMDRMDFALTTVVPVVVLIIAFFKMNQQGRYINYQVKIQRVMLFFMLSGIVMLLLIKEVSVFQLIYFVPGFAFFVAHYLLTIRFWLLAETHTLLIIGLIVINALFPLKRWLYIDRFINLDDLIVHEVPFHDLAKDKTLWVIGDDVNMYSQSTLATPYLNWQLSSEQISQIGYYDNMTEVYTSLTNNLPQVILDKHEIIEDLFTRMPTLAAKYERSVSQQDVYLLREN